MSFLLKFRKKIHWHYLILLFLAACFFVGTSSFNYFTQYFNPASEEQEFVKWLSPDETANYIFAKLYAQEGRISIFEKYNLYANDIMHPRSFRSDIGILKPVSFLGIILIFGKIASISSYKILPFLTPLFAAVGLFYYYLLVKELFGRRNAFWSAFILASFPVYIYYSARSMFHNVLFVVLLIIGFYYGFLMVRKRRKVKIYKKHYLDIKNYLAAAAAGFFIGLAVITRTSELFWLAPILFLIWIFNLRAIGLTKLIIFLSFLFLAFLPAAYYNTILYGQPYYGGYVEMNNSLTNISQASVELVKTSFHSSHVNRLDLLRKIKANFFPFGIQAAKSWEMFRLYFIDMFWWIFWPAILGLVLFAERLFKNKKKHYVFLLVYFISSWLLILYYGSWDFHDNPNPESCTIGNSYTRYWLPIYLGAMPFVSLSLNWFTCLVLKGKRFSYRATSFFSPYSSRQFWRTSLMIVFIIFIYFISFNFVLVGSEEGLVFSFYKQKDSREEWQCVLNLTPGNSVIITFYHDKLFFPERKVVVGLFDDKNMISQYAHLVKYLPAYYYNFTLPLDTIDYLNRRRLGEQGLQIKEVFRISSDFSLYKIELKQKNK